MKKLDRRCAVRGVLGVLTALCMGARANAATACSSPASESLRASLGYKDTSPRPAQPCSACSFFTAADAKASCGDCMILSDKVNARGHCESWSPR